MRFQVILCIIIFAFNFTLNAARERISQVNIIGPTSVIEGQTAQYQFKLSRKLQHEVSVSFKTQSISANNSDFSEQIGSITIAKRSTSASISIKTFDDSLVESTESFSILITSVTGADIGNSLVTTNILDNDVPSDITAPSIPENIQLMVKSSSQIDLKWDASTDDISGVKFYYIYRNGELINQTSNLNFTDSSLSSSTSYTYNIAAIDNSGNISAKSSSISASTSAEDIPTASCSNEANICVGLNQSVKTISEAIALAQAGQTIELADSVYNESFGVNIDDITIRSAPNNRAKIDCSSGVYWRKACILAIANNLKLENIIVTGARGAETNEACFRNEPYMNVSLKNVECYGSNNGILGSGGSWTVEESLFYNNGYGDGYSHNMYFSHSASPCTKVIIRRTKSYNSNNGHALKSRCHQTIIEDSELRDNSTANAIDFSDGGDALILRSLITQPDGSNGVIIRHGSESCKNLGSLSIQDSEIINLRSMGYIIGSCGTIEFINTIVPSNVNVSN